MHLIPWLYERANTAQLRIKKISVEQLNEWQITKRGILHKTERFFSIVAIRETFKDKVTVQPIIKQIEIGILGFLFSKKENKTRILLQAKTEPGNIGGTQIGPTVQATFSNYMQVHKGKPTPFIDYFKVPSKSDSLQSEQGTRFHGKYNRNASVFLSDENEAPEFENWKWFDLQEVLQNLSTDFILNTDSRSVLVCSDWNLISDSGEAFSMSNTRFAKELKQSLLANHSKAQPSTNNILSILEKKRATQNNLVQEIAFEDLESWYTESKMQLHPFSIIGLSVSVQGREVELWDQPLIASNQDGKVILYYKRIDNILHFLVGMSCEIGFQEKVQYGPSLMIQDGKNYSGNENIINISSHLVDEYKQSDEGGRFYKSVTTYQLREIEPTQEVQLGETHIWMTLGQVKALLNYKGVFNNEFRSVLSLILKYV